MTPPLLHVDRASKLYTRGGLLGREVFRAVDDVSFHLDATEPQIFTIIGESGSGKTTLARMILNMIRPSGGTIFFKGKDLGTIRGAKARRDFMSQVQPIFQNPFEAFNPLKRVDRYLFMTARNFTSARSQAQMEAAADAALNKVGLSIGEVRGRFPHELSGGQLQRVAIARALIPGPSMIIADEPVSMVDASLRMSIVNLFRTLRNDLNVSIIYITHDLATAYCVSDGIIIMQQGKVVESGQARTVLDNPKHSYSQLLKASVLSPDPHGRGVLTGDSAASQQARASPPPPQMHDAEPQAH
ncbi:ABC transporter ATP-binding protein [Neorhizobium sp. DT-125]|uniref:ABC transporter ATP-binding protein n=1 Tax=Neorhizobium sp. DT-125 TaxID=3396163 RepID=UPI003F1C5F13